MFFIGDRNTGYCKNVIFPSYFERCPDETSLYVVDKRGVQFTFYFNDKESIGKFLKDYYETGKAKTFCEVRKFECFDFSDFEPEDYNREIEWNDLDDFEREY